MLFTMVPVQDALGHIANLFPAEVTALFLQVVMAKYFQSNGGCYEMIDGVVTGS